MDRHQTIVAEMAVPLADTLCCFTASIDLAGERDASAKSDFHCQIYNCRKLIFTQPVLAAPVLGTERDVAVVCRREDVQEDSALRLFMAKERLSLGRLRHPSDGEYAGCLQYTISAHMAPAWNPVENKLVQGRDFLASGEPRDAVRLEVNVRGDTGMAWLSLSFSRLRIPPMDFGELDVSAPALQNFLQEPFGELAEIYIGKPWVTVLPSLKRGMVVGISKGIPSDCLYQNYTELRRHWKNMYGYRLPRQPGEMPYLSVYFMPLGSQLMTYPWLCVAPHSPTVVRCPDPQAVAVSFVGDLATCVSTVCGQPSPVSLGSLGRPVAGLQSAQHLAGPRDDAHLQPNLRGLRENTPSPMKDDDLPIPASCPLSMTTQRDGTRPVVEWNFLKRAPRGDDNKENEEPHDEEQQQEPLRRPVFRARTPRAPSPRAAPPSLPWFNPRATSTPKKAEPVAGPSHQHSPPSGYSSSGGDSGRGSSPANTPTKLPLPALHVPTFKVPPSKPIFLPRLNISQPKARVQPQGTARTPAAAISRSAAPGSAGISAAPGAVIPRAATPGSAGISAAPGAVIPRAAAPGSAGISAAPGAAIPRAATPGSAGISAAPGAAIPRAAAPGSAGISAAPGAAIPRAAASGSAGISAAPGAAWPRPGGSTSRAASPRAAPGAPVARKEAKKRSAESPLVPELTSVEAVRRCSIPMLMAWLREKGVPCKSRDKKADLVDKVASILAANSVRLMR